MNGSSKVYLSGPITGTVDYKERFKAKQRELWGLGIAWVMNPAEVMSHMPCSIQYREIMNICYSMMAACDTIYLMKGWRQSSGCRIEVAYARSH